MMKQKSIIAKIFLAIFILGLSLWIGGTVVRYALAYDIFVPGTALELKNWYSDSEMLTTVHLFRIAAFYTIFGFCSAFASAIVLFFYWRKDLKKHGWLFISFMLLLIASPIEFYLMYYDIKLMLAFNDELVNSFNDVVVQEYFIGRFKSLTIPAMLSFLSIISIIVMVVWQPLDKPEKNKTWN